MLNFCSLYSGSSGNSLFVETENTKILVDVGLSCKKIEEALASIEKDLSSIDAILITHEHSDHVKGLGIFSKKFQVPVYANFKPTSSWSRRYAGWNCWKGSYDVIRWN